ncbi:hypothetical protein F4824DRAFT_444779 [Ustulina deusta]|nr:hypothetical protein F4824DRAFT_444779 [Ustulina deusta]
MMNDSIHPSAASRNIAFKQQDDTWPNVHKTSFQDIQVLGDKKFRAWTENDDTRSNQNPWIRNTTARVKYLVRRACYLATHVQPSETGWRMELENEVLRRFSVEVACPNCRARLWRSEIEAAHGKVDKWARELEQRRQRRKSCQCPPQSRPQDFYETGECSLFDDRVEEAVVLPDLPKKIPDRVFGLRLTEKLGGLVTTLATTTMTAGQPFECTPFKLATNPPIFPFLALEAKSESSKNSFHDIETQTALPIWKFLELQRQLKLKTQTAEDALVWFIGYRGSAWKVYGCYIDVAKGALRYNIHALWGGDLTTNDGALQLILIVDYIIDWARDVYRATILREMQALATGKSWDEISVGFESEIYSQYNRVFNWIPGTNSTVDCGSEEKPATEYPQQLVDDNPALLNHRNLLSIDLPKTKLGSIQSTSSTHYYFGGLCITEENVDSLLTLSKEPNHSLRPSPEDARYLIHSLQRHDELIVTTQHVLDEMEYMWTGRRRPFNSEFYSASEIEVYAILEYRCFIDQSWNIMRQLTCLLVSKSACSILMKLASNESYQPKQLSNISRGCPSTAIYEAIECLLSDSPLQVLQSAITGTMLSIRPVLVPNSSVAPTSPIQILSFHAHSQFWIRHTVKKYSSLAKKRPPQETWRSTLSKRARQEGGWPKWEEWLSDYRRSTADRSFERQSNRTAHDVSKGHNSFSCSRCTKYNESRLVGCPNIRRLGAPWEPISVHPSTHNTILVQGAQDDTTGKVLQQRHDFCLFIIGDGPSLSEDVACLADVVKAHLGSGQIYHTILQSPESLQPDNTETEGFERNGVILYNLPCPYRPYTKREYNDLNDWLMELQGKQIPAKAKNTTGRLWTHTQMILSYLRQGVPCNKVTDFVKPVRDEELDSFWRDPDTQDRYGNKRKRKR